MDKKDQLLAKADQPGIEAMKLHPFYKGKIEVVPKACIRDFQDFAIWYTPGVAKPCLDIRDNPETVYEHTNKANLVAVITDGTRVLGLGDIGPEASLPVMEGKAMLFQISRRHRCFPDCSRYQRPREDYRNRADASAGVWRRQSRGYLPAQMLPHSR